MGCRRRADLSAIQDRSDLLTRTWGKLKRVAIALDVGNASTTAILCGKTYSTNRAHIYDEKTLKGKRGSGKTDDEIVQAVAEMASEHDAEIVIVDSAASSTIEALKSYPQRKWKVKLAKKQVIPGIRHTGAALASGKVQISPKAQETIKELQGYQWGKDEKPLKQDDHHCDALRYYTMSEIKRTIEPRPRAFTSRALILERNKNRGNNNGISKFR